VAEQVEDRHRDSVPGFDDRDPIARSLRAGVRGTDHALARGEVGGDPAAAVRVITERDDVGSGAEQLVGELGRDARAVRGVLAVDDRDIDLVPLAQRRKLLLDGATTRDAEDIRKEEDLQGVGLPSRSRAQEPGGPR
jgi:hypothetical protein